MFRNLLALLLVCAPPVALAQTDAPAAAWKDKVAEELPLLGHRNWILIVDSAYPLQSSPGLETIETGAGLPDVVETVLGDLNGSIHVRPEIYMDAELPFVPDDDAPEAAKFRKAIADELHAYAIHSLPHEKMIAMVGEAGQTFHVLVLKTNTTIPYSSVFIRLNCRYWSDAAEARLRAKMSAAGGK
jgi:hypothetical protein